MKLCAALRIVTNKILSPDVILGCKNGLKYICGWGFALLGEFRVLPRLTFYILLFAAITAEK